MKEGGMAHDNRGLGTLKPGEMIVPLDVGENAREIRAYHFQAHRADVIMSD
ncbi:MAG: hypothetical protein Ct9H300mP6_02580 [Gammaproteobacteria bacterium]|nr:MAG: hypothetical protein Ct9H300mP6_02580 [Gammaproteobacteria bacterium]